MAQQLFKKGKTMYTDIKLKHTILGVDHGNFGPAGKTRKRFLEQIEIAKKLLPDSVSAIFAPSVGFTNKLAELGKDDDVFAPWFLRTINKADAGLTESPKIGIVFFNADCPILCLHQENKLVTAHLGYRCVIRENPAEEGLIEVCMKHFDPRQVKAFIFGGIGPCCWVPEADKTEINKPQKCRHPEILSRCLSKTTRSPLGKNLVSVDLCKLTRLLLLKCGALPEKISWNWHCTCCSSVQKNGEPSYWSHTRFLAKGQNGIDGRNFAAAWLE